MFASHIKSPRPVILKTLLLISSCFLMNVAVCQVFFFPRDFKLWKKTNNGYKQFHSVGKTENNLKTGFWKEISTDSVIYSFGVYKKGVPIGVWQINYPDGTIRKTTTFDTSGYIVNWARYGGKNKIVEIYSDKKIPYDMYIQLNRYEEMVFQSEITETSSNIIHRSSEDENIHRIDNYRFYHQPYEILRESYYYYIGSYPDLCKVFYPLIDVVKDFKGYFKIKYFYSNGLLKDQFYIQNGVVTSRINYEYKLKKLKKEYIYWYGKLQLIEYYNKKGEKVKEKKLNN